jgi:Anti-sigma factor NepR
VDDSPLRHLQAPDDRDEARVDLWLKAWFQQMLAEPVPPRFHDLIERLSAASGL